jgi:hypothetical protein
MALTLGDLFQNWNPDTNIPSSGATVDGGIVSMLEPGLFRDKTMLPGITYATDVEELMVTNRFAAAYIRKLDKIAVSRTKATASNAFRVVPTQSDGQFLLVECNDVLKVAEVVNDPIDQARVSGRTADKVALSTESYEEIRELQYLSYLVNGGGSQDPTDVGTPASANVVRSTPETILANIIADRATMLKAGARPDTILISVDTDAALINLVGNRTYYRTPSESELLTLGNEFAGTLFSGKVKIFTTNNLGQDNSSLVGESDNSEDWDWTNIEYILYDHRTLCIVNVARYIGLVDYSALVHNSTLISILSVCGGRVRNTQKAVAKKFTTPVIVKDPAVLTFTVEEEDGTAISGATIALKTGAVVGSGDAVSAESDGTYELVVGTYNYSISKANFKTKTGTFDIIESQLEKNVSLTVVLEADA